jgi:hypothetical protein
MSGVVAGVVVAVLILAGAFVPYALAWWRGRRRSDGYGRPASHGTRRQRRLLSPPGLRCWARVDTPRPVYGMHSPYWTACGAGPASDLGLCAHHESLIFPPEVRTHAPPRL